MWSLVKRVDNYTVIQPKWIFKKKLGSDGSDPIFKARLVVKGYTQSYGIDYDDTFAPVVRFKSLRTLFLLAVQHDLELHQLDVTCAFLNRNLNETIDLAQPKAFTAPSKEDYVLHLMKSLYGLKQSPRVWNATLESYLKPNLT